MVEKTEWEVVDAPEQARRPSMRDILKGMLGPHWRWKVLGGAVVAGITLVFFAAITTLAVLAGAAGALILLVIGKIRQWLHRAEHTVSTSVMHK